MQTVLEALEPYANGERARVSQTRVFLARWLGELFGCQHKEMSRPFSRQGETFRVCIACGARRQFDEKTWISNGPFYFKAARTAELRRQ